MSRPHRTRLRADRCGVVGAAPSPAVPGRGTPDEERKHLSAVYDRLSRVNAELRRQIHVESSGGRWALVILLGLMITASAAAPVYLALQAANALLLAVSVGLVALGVAVVALAFRSDRAEEAAALRDLTLAAPSPASDPVMTQLLAGVAAGLRQLKTLRSKAGWTFLILTMVGLTVSDFLASYIANLAGLQDPLLALFVGPIAVLVLLAPYALREEWRLDRHERELKGLEKELDSLESSFFAKF
jgi:uncharacterized membrane protein YdjX (TVP38/TMEM64 family)